MMRRITITIDKDVENKIRDIQVERIAETRKSTSFSQVINELLKKALKDEDYIFNVQYR